MAGLLDRIKNGVMNLVNKVKEKVEEVLNDFRDGGTKSEKTGRQERNSSPAPSAPAPAPAKPAPARAPASQGQAPSIPHYSRGQPIGLPPAVSNTLPIAKIHQGTTKNGTEINGTNPATHMQMNDEKGTAEISCPILDNGMPGTARVDVPQSVYDKGGSSNISPNGRTVKITPERGGKEQVIDVPDGHFQNGGKVEVDKKGKLVATDRDGNVVAQQRPEISAKAAAAAKTVNGHGGTTRDDKGPDQAPAQTPQNPTKPAPQKQAAPAR